MPIDPLRDLLSQKLAEAETLRRWGHAEQADALEQFVGEIEDALAARDRELLTVHEAASESGYSEERLRELVREGTLPDIRPEDSQGQIRIPRGALPKRPGHGISDVPAPSR